MPYDPHAISPHLIERLYVRLQNITRRGTINVTNDAGAYQEHQITGFPGEVRDHIVRPQEFGISSCPLPGSEVVVLNGNGGYPGTGAIVSTGDPRYRPTGQQPGETTLYMVDGAGGTGNGGTMRALVSGAIGWVSSFLGKTINVGDTNAVTINCGTTAGSVTINMGGSSATVNIEGASGDVKVSGVSLKSHTHSGVTPGDGNTGEPNT
jgi:phage baseplate assembly protein V